MTEKIKPGLHTHSFTLTMDFQTCESIATDSPILFVTQ